MADYAFDRFGAAFKDRLDALGYSFTRACEVWPQVDRAMLSRATRGQTISAGNLLLLCQMAGIDPFEFLVVEHRARKPHITIKSILNQAVTEPASRETGGC